MTVAATVAADNLVEWALRYAAAGWPVLPLHSVGGGRCSCGHVDCASPGKHPRTPHGLKEATTATTTVRQWWSRWPAAHIGLRTGDAFDVLDLDGDTGIASVLALTHRHGPLPDGPAVATGGGGLHLYFAPTGLGNRAGLLPNVDWRGRGGYVVAPPSGHHSGGVYTWEEPFDRPLPAAPPWLAAILDPPAPARTNGATSIPAGATGGAYGARAVERELAELARAQVGMRNHQLNISAFNLYQLVAGGELDDDTVTAALRDTAISIGLTPKEVDATLGSARKAGSGNPRRAPAPVVPISSARGPRPKTTGPADPAAAAGRLADTVATFRRWLHLPDPGALYAVLGATAANLLPGDPVWLLLVGPPGCGKTETVAPLGALPYVHPAAVVSPASLLSGTARKERERGATGGLLHQVGDFGVILIKDFTSLLSLHSDARSEALAALREVYDGRYDRPVGTGGGRVLSWSGKCGVVAGCTPTIDRHHGVMATMGERFAFYRLNVDDPKEQARRRIANRRREAEMREELAAGVLTVLEPVEAAGRDNLTPADTERIVAWAHFATWARTGVERDGYSHDVVLMPSVEAPARLAGVLVAMHAGLTAIGASPDDGWRVVTKIAWDSIPDIRRRLLLALRPAYDTLSTADIVELTGIPKTSAQRNLEDLALLGLLDRTKAGMAENAAWQWNVSAMAAAEWPNAAAVSAPVAPVNGCEPEKPGGSI